MLIAESWAEYEMVTFKKGVTYPPVRMRWDPTNFVSTPDLPVVFRIRISHRVKNAAKLTGIWKQTTAGSSVTLEKREGGT
jgi:hypothetical protein